MNELGFVKYISLPRGARLIDASVFYTSTQSHEDTLTERVVLDMLGIDVQILRYNLDDSNVLVYVGEKAKMMHLNNVGKYIEQNV